MVWSEQFGVRTHSEIYRNTSTASQVRVYLNKTLSKCLIFGQWENSTNKIESIQQSYQTHPYVLAQWNEDQRWLKQSAIKELQLGHQILKALNTKVPQTPSLLLMCYSKQHRREGQRCKAKVLLRAFYLWISIFSKVLERSSPSIQDF